ncbi:MAG: tRNA (adenosine(37)-N6)-dimethylallyltransferase MiaA, partial [Candidatus Omnitrophica bacterium]|nr:tRNA (adenosine(37)-N6)-dimethylallyltransferase MiaA [Candidatus Omnitrophota bacterium]
MKKKIIFLVGPTAIGKSEAAVWLAKKLKAEIISCDSMQVYKGMDILTSQPAVLFRKKARHHLFRIISAVREYDVARYRSAALKKIKEIHKKGNVPLFVGGTGLYMTILVEGIFRSKAQNATVRKDLYRQAQEKGSQYLYERLKKIDPEAAVKIHPNDLRRLVRALEVYLVSGKPISSLQKERRGLYSDYDVRIFCLDMQRDRLYGRIEKRIDKMFRQGLLKEAKRLLRLKLSKTASCAIGIKEIRGY